MANNELIPSNQNFALFEAASIKQFIIDHLNKNGVYIDQNYLGSNLNCFIDIIAAMLQQLLFHYNMTATESTFSTAVLYENINKIVGLLNYKPNGKQTAILPVKILANLFTSQKFGTFVIPRYSFITANTNYVVRNDISFNFTEYQESSTVIDTVLYQGNLTESEEFILSGEDFQTITLIDTLINGTSGQFIADNFFDVYVKGPNEGDRWVQYSEVSTLFDYRGSDCIFERRLNENYNWEFKFGNNINGKKPTAGSKVVIFYLVSDGNRGEMNTADYDMTSLKRYNSNLFNEIILDDTIGIYSRKYNYVTINDLQNINVSVTGPSTKVSSPESTELIRENVPKIFSAQNRLLTAGDYSSYIKKMFSNFVKDCYIFNNDEYTADLLKYYYDLGLSRPNEDNRVLLNQVNFETSCAFNNVYVVLLPLINTIIDGKVPNYVNVNLKQYIVNKLNVSKNITHNIVPTDPIYKAVSFGIIDERGVSDEILPTDFDDVKLVLIRDKYSIFNNGYIMDNAVSVFTDYFNNVALGDTIDIVALSTALNQISGVKRIEMRSGSVVNKKLTFVIWNPLYYEKDITVSQQNEELKPYMFHYFYNLDNIKEKILIEDE